MRQRRMTDEKKERVRVKIKGKGKGKGENATSYAAMDDVAVVYTSILYQFVEREVYDRLTGRTVEKCLEKKT